MVVELRLTLIDSPEATLPTPLSILPSPLENLAIKFTLVPKIIIELDAVKLFTVGSTTSIVILSVTSIPAEFETVNV